MNNKASFRVALSIMIVALVIMAINSTFFPMNDWVIRIVGMVMMIDLVVLVYSFMRNKRKVT
ncbi:MAG: hypothetical protein K8R73_07505 [Clostridiales bacterium]|nr:hypothetical protein [Clostridiales bacterium]